MLKAKIKATKTIYGDYLYRGIFIKVRGHYAIQVGRSWNTYHVYYKTNGDLVKKVSADSLSKEKDIINYMLDEFDFFSAIYLKPQRP